MCAHGLSYSAQNVSIIKLWNPNRDNTLYRNNHLTESKAFSQPFATCGPHKRPQKLPRSKKEFTRWVSLTRLMRGDLVDLGVLDARLKRGTLQMGFWFNSIGTYLLCLVSKWWCKSLGFKASVGKTSQQTLQSERYPVSAPTHAEFSASYSLLYFHCFSLCLVSSVFLDWDTEATSLEDGPASGTFLLKHPFNHLSMMDDLQWKYIQN